MAALTIPGFPEVSSLAWYSPGMCSFCHDFERPGRVLCELHVVDLDQVVRLQLMQVSKLLHVGLVELAVVPASQSELQEKALGMLE